MEKQTRCKEQKPRCVRMIYGTGAFRYRCSNVAKVERNGNLYCNIHDPMKVAERNTKRQDAAAKSRQRTAESRQRRQVTRQSERIKDLNEIIAAIRAGARSDDSVDATYNDGRSRIELHVTKFSDLYC